MYLRKKLSGQGTTDADHKTRPQVNDVVVCVFQKVIERVNFPRNLLSITGVPERQYCANCRHQIVSLTRFNQADEVLNHLEHTSASTYICRTNIHQNSERFWGIFFSMLLADQRNGSGNRLANRGIAPFLTQDFSNITV